ncbi:MAG TPA: glutamate--tRNA ligase [Syntrophorhabdaceae bacterium]|nr:glutamate--tRNA ligase [Syntrophorhabdaceae bacterium]
MVKVRFAPSPTGHLHIGNAKVALLNYLFARRNQGKFVLRIEDTDLERSDTSYEASILDDLGWLGIAYDEGPLRQTERFDIYRSYARQLLDKGAAYKCFCSEETLERMREASLKNGQPPRYDGTCSKLSDGEIFDLESSGKPYVIRFRSQRRIIRFVDEGYRGEVAFPLEHVDDFILMKQGETPSYNFAVTIDDMLMNITHVIRGADHLSNTPKQIMLFQALGATPPHYAHLSLLVGEDRKPLSKRYGATRVRDFREMGILAEALRNYLGTVGRSVTKEIMDMNELAESFSLASLSRTDSFFDMEKLYWFNKEYMKKIPLETLLKELDLPVEYRERIAILRENAATLNEMRDYLDIFEKPHMNEEAQAYLAELKLPDGFVTKLSGFFTGPLALSLENVVSALTEESQLKKKDLYMVLRTVLTGRKSGPPLKEIFELIPRDLITERINRYLSTGGRR